MTLQKVCYKAVVGSVIIHVQRCVNIVLCGLVHSRVLLLCVHKTKSKTKKYYTIMCVSASVTVFVHTCVRGCRINAPLPLR